MQNQRLSFFLILVLILSPLGLAAQALQALPKLQGRVTDTTGTLTDSEISKLEAKLKALEDAKGSQLVVAIVESTQPETIEDYSIRLAEAWKIGRKGVDDGVILLIAKKDRKLRIEVGYGLEGAIPDARAKAIIEDYIVPKFKRGDYYGGIDLGTNAIIQSIKGEELPPPAKTKSRSSKWNGWIGFIIIFFMLFTSSQSWKRRLILTGGVSLATALALGFLGILPWIAAAIVGMVLWIFMFIVSGIVGMGGRGGGSGGGSWSSGGSSWSSGGSSFSGGGGSFGGGGSSGSW